MSALFHRVTVPARAKSLFLWNNPKTGSDGKRHKFRGAAQGGWGEGKRIAYARGKAKSAGAPGAKWRRERVRGISQDSPASSTSSRGRHPPRKRRCGGCGAASAGQGLLFDPALRSAVGIRDLAVQNCRERMLGLS